MQPTMYSGDLAVLLREGEYTVGNIVAFQASGGNVIHRIVGGSAADGFVTQGDNKNAPDPWRPHPDEILGKLWLHVPGAGRIIAYLRQPAPFATLVGSLAALALLGGAGAKRRRRRTKQMANAEHGKHGSRLAASPGLLTALGAALVLALAFAGGAFFLFRQPAGRSEFVERLRYEHATTYEYAVTAEPSVLYPEGKIGPVTAGADGKPATAPPPIYTKLARTLDVTFTYALNSPLPPEVSGDLRAALVVQAGEKGWSKITEVLAPQPFSGATASGRVSVDIGSVLALIDTIEKEAGVSAGTYDVAVVPTVRLAGRIGTEPVDETYSAPFAFKLNRAQIVPEAGLVRSEVKKVGDDVTREAEVGIFGLAVPVALGRWLCLAGTAVSLVAGAYLGVVLLLGLRHDEEARLRLQYGLEVVSVADVELGEGTETVRMASVEDLARLAKRDGGVVFRGKPEGGSPFAYFVREGEVVYYASPSQNGHKQWPEPARPRQEA